jgi:nickel-dependent lactate racemase
LEANRKIPHSGDSSQTSGLDPGHSDDGADSRTRVAGHVPMPTPSGLPRGNIAAMADTVHLRYGRSTLDVRLPPGAQPTLIGKRPLSKLADPHAAVRQALDRPVAAAPYGELVRGRRSACILICDVTRPVPNHLFLRPLIEGLLNGGVPKERITVLVATGLHRPNEGAELAAVVNDPWVLGTVRVENHFARDDAAHVDMGFTATRGTPVGLDRRFVEADLRIATGLVEPHFMAGYSGGRKVVAPGVAHADTIRTFHSARFMEDPLAVQCNLAGNPLHEEQLEIVRMLGEVYALNTVIDDDRDLVHVNFGEVVASHLATVAFVDESIRVPVGRRFRTIVTSAAGHPLDKTYYQTIKGMVTPLDILEPGGTLIIASACSEGFGSREFREAQARLRMLGPDAFLQSLLAKRFADVDEWQTEMQLKSTRVGRVRLYTTGLDENERSLTGVDAVDSVDAALADALAASGDASVAVIPEGPYVVPVVA